MRRRRFLRTGALAVGGVVGVSGWAGGIGNAVSQPEPFEPLGTLEIDGLSEVVVDDTGTVAYGALRDGFVVVDVSDPTAPTELARVTGILADAENGPVHEIFDVKVSGDRLFVGGPRHGGGDDEASGFELFDVSDPATPARVAGFRTDHGIHNAFLAGETAYLTGTGAEGAPLVIYDVSGDEPAEVSRWSVERADPAWGSVPTTFRTCHDVYVQDDVAVVAYWDAGTWLLDVSDPANPAGITGLGGVPPESLPRSTGRGFPSMMRELPGNSHYAQPSPDGSLLAVGKEAWDDEETEVDGGPGGIELWEISDVSNPTRLTTLAPPGAGHTSHNFGWRGDRLYTSWYGGGVRVFDLSEPSSPTLLADWADEETTSFWTAKPAADEVVASSHLDPRGAREDRFSGVGATLYTFPEPGDSDGAPAETVTPRPTPRVTETPTSPEPNTRTTSPPVTTDPSSTPSATEPSDGTGDRPPGGTDETAAEVSGGGAPGFGILATLAAGGIAAWRLATRRNDGE